MTDEWMDALVGKAKREYGDKRQEDEHERQQTNRKRELGGAFWKQLHELLKSKSEEFNRKFGATNVMTFTDSGSLTVTVKAQLTSNKSTTADVSYDATSFSIHWTEKQSGVSRAHRYLLALVSDSVIVAVNQLNREDKKGPEEIAREVIEHLVA